MLLKGIYMLNKLPQYIDTIVPNMSTPSDTVSYISDQIERSSSKYMTVDISNMNVLDACFVSTLCSTKHFSKYPNGKITWKVSSESVKEFNKDLDLGNCNYIF